VITFDADQTLVDFRSAMQTALQAVLAELRRRVPAAAVLTPADLQATRMRVADELGRSARMEEIRGAAFARTLEELGQPDGALAAELTKLYLERRFGELRPYDDVLPALDALQTSCRLGLVSNGNSYPDKIGLAGYFRFVVFAHDRGLRKADPGFYEDVLSVARCDANELVHVGDSLENDVFPARAIGVRTVWLNRAGGAKSAMDFAEIHSLAELPALLGFGSSDETAV
jgi:FMN hydrolase / 5-amino-6-(5-phospho-D-ribitylamino)uracil phosphatase